MSDSYPDLSQYTIDDTWVVAESQIRDLPVIVRIRQNLMALAGHPKLGQRLRVVWKYESDSEFGLPRTEEMSVMDLCENALLSQLEHDNHAILTHILTGDCLRQWIFYTGDLEEAVERIRTVMDSDVETPIEATAMADETWSEYVETLEGLGLTPDDKS